MKRLLAAALVMLGACGDPTSPVAVQHRPAPAATASVAQVTPSTSASTLSPAPSATANGEPFLAWLHDGEGSARFIAIAPFGDVVVVTRLETPRKKWMLRVHARDSGRVLEESEVCDAWTGEFAFAAPQRAILVCRNELREITFPGLSWRKAMTFEWPHDVAGTDGQRLALAHDGQQIQIFDLTTWTEIERFDVDRDVEQLRFSHDRRKLLIALDDGDVHIREIGKSTRPLLEGRSRATALALSPSDKEVFVHHDSFTALAYPLGKRRPTRRYKVGSWVSHAEYLPSGAIAGGGSDGLSLFAPDGKKRLLQYAKDHAPVVEDVAVSEDGTMICGADRDGRVACFATRRPAATHYP
jgi:hypothetical protein